MRKGDWISTYTGGQFWPLDPRPEEVVIEDIAHALALMNRFNGHTSWPYSVAQHSVLCSLNVAKEFAFEALMHDATEAYLPDVPGPVKRFMPEFKTVENKIWTNAIVPKYNLPLEKRPDIKAIDIQMLVTEAKQLLNADWWCAEHYPEVLNVEIEELSWQEAECAFLNRFWELI